MAAPAHAAPVTYVVGGAMNSTTGVPLNGTATAYYKRVSGTTTTFDYLTQVKVTNGAYSFNLPAGDYKFEFESTFSATGTNYTPEYYNDKANLDTADVVTVTTSAVTLDTVALAPWPTVTGTVTSLAGTPVNGMVYAYGRILNSATTPPTITWPTTADYSAPIINGAYSLPVFPGEEYKFQFVSTDLPLVSEWYNDKVSIDVADPVLVNAPTTLAAVSLATQPVVSGRVVDGNGAPVAGTSVRAYSTVDSAGKPITTQGRDLKSTTTDAFGYFRFNLPAGAYKISVDGTEKWIGEWYNDKVDFATADVVTVSTATDLGVIALAAGGAITGTVTSDAGLPLERIYVTASGRGDYTNAAGVYVIEDVPAGVTTLKFSDPVGEFLTEWATDKKDCYQVGYTCTAAEKTANETPDPVTVGRGAVATVNANMTPNPATAIIASKVDISGKVIDSAGKSVVGATVQAWTTPADGSKPKLAETARVRRDGGYYFMNLGLSADPALNGSLPAEDTYRIYAVDNMPAEKDAYVRYDGRFYGDGTLYAQAKDVVAGATGTGINITLPLTGGITGVITSEVGLSVANVNVALRGVNGRDTGTAATERADGVYKNFAIVPGDYKVYFSDGNAVAASGMGAAQGVEWHAPEWYDNTSFDKAKVITITSGATTSAINAALGKALIADEAPEIEGDAYVGKTLSIGSKGLWNVTNDAVFTYEWLVDGAVVATTPTLVLTSAMVDKSVSLRVNVAWNAVTGTATSLPVKVGYLPKVKVKKDGSWLVFKVNANPVKSKQISGTVKVQEIVGTDAEGMPVYKSVGQAKIKKGEGVASLKKIIKKVGKHKLEFTFAFNSKVGAMVMPKTVKIKGASSEKVTPKPVLKSSKKKDKKGNKGTKGTKGKKKKG